MSLIKSQIYGVALLIMWAVLSALAARTQILSSVLLSVSLLCPVLVGFFVAKFYKTNSIFGAFLVGVVFVILVILGNLLVNQGSGLLYAGGVIIVPFLTTLGGMVGKIVTKTQ